MLRACNAVIAGPPVHAGGCAPFDWNGGPAGAGATQFCRDISAVAAAVLIAHVTNTHSWMKERGRPTLLWGLVLPTSPSRRVLHSISCKSPEMADFGSSVMSDLSPECARKRTSVDRSEFMVHALVDEIGRQSMRSLYRGFFVHLVSLWRPSYLTNAVIHVCSLK